MTVRKKTKICLGCLREISLNDSVCPFCGFDPVKVKNPRYLRVGTKLLNRYLVGREIGEGGFGITYVGYDVKLKRPIAIKEYFPAHIASRDATVYRSQDVICFDGKGGKFFESGLERFRKEGKTLEKASFCDSVIQVYDYFEENKTAYIVMEYVPGITVQQRVDRQGAFTPEEMLTVVMPLMDDLQKLHEKGMLHRDISPDNIILRPDGVAKLIDFGSARRTLLDEKGNNKSMTVVVRQQYTPREQYSRNGKQGPWTDIYSLATTIYFMLTAKAPASALERESAVANAKMQSSMNQLKTSLVDVLETGMAVNLEERYSDMKSFQEELKKEISLSDTKPIEKTVYFDREKEWHKILPKWKKKRIYMGAGICLAVFLIGLYSYKYAFYADESSKPVAKLPTSAVNQEVTKEPAKTAVPQLVTMPDLSDKKSSEVAGVVRQMDENITVVIEKKYSNRKKNRVCGQSIKPGEQYISGEKKEMVVYVSMGIKKIRVPDVSGKTLSEAKSILRAKGLSYKVKKQFSKSKKNSIIKQSRKNVRVKKNTVIHLTVSKGEKRILVTPSPTQKPKTAPTKKPNRIKIITG